MFSLTLAEAASRGIQFLTAAYLTRAILDEGFGILGFANAITVYFIVFITLGFNVVGIREIAKSSLKIKEYVNSIITIRLIIAAISYLILCGIVFSINKPIIVKYTLLIAGINFFAQAFLLDWLYQAIERMEIQAIRQVTTGILTLLGTVLLVHSPKDVMLAMIVTVFSAVLNSLWMLTYYIKLYGGIRMTYNKELWVNMLKSSIPIGFTNLIITNYNYLNAILLSSYRNDSETGIYSAAFKVLVVTILPAAVIQNAFFPALSRAESREDRIKIMKKYSSLIFLVSAITASIIFSFSEEFTVIAFGSKFIFTGKVLKILMVTSLLMQVNVTFTGPLMAWNKEKQVMYVIGIGGAVSTIFNFLLIPYYGYLGAAYVTIISELVVLLGLSILGFKVVRKLFFFDLIKFLAFGTSCSLVGYYLSRFGVHSIISAIISFLLFLGINLIFKTFTIAELKGYIKK